jgi:hypothetical protein
MQVVKDTVVRGKVAPHPGSFPDGAEVGTFAAGQNNHAVRLPPALQRELESALAEADQAPGISAEELFAELRKYD